MKATALESTVDLFPWCATVLLTDDVAPQVGPVLRRGSHSAQITHADGVDQLARRVDHGQAGHVVRHHQLEGRQRHVRLLHQAKLVVQA